jgi:hypothetical protein
LCHASPRRREEGDVRLGTTAERKELAWPRNENLQMRQERERANVPVATLCRILEIFRRGVYASLERPESARVQRIGNHVSWCARRSKRAGGTTAVRAC